MIIDIREPKEYRDLFHGAEIRKLEVGDYTNGKIIIERKSANDFVSSLFDNRLWRQLDNMSQHRSIVLIVGNLNTAVKANTKRSRRPYTHTWNMVYGAYSSMVARENYRNIKIAHVNNKTEFQFMVNKIFEKCDHKQKHTEQLRSTSPNPALNILLGFPGISTIRAKKLLTEYRTPQNAVSSIDEWGHVLGEATAKKARDAFTSRG